ncbi:hypothetical protein BCR33DRAFT_720893 [Rhizoclosmatium globosum]|uniref:F-box domain-containing protein n=1 Tax=Rhizoclosmatium globosum TaxID=329046 RepID=A0A1Y2BU75_9FUNG|nr:hypothetical protein BCR33DRAFT_720893 [Rhizoclosmatium globosum]|eukprot:ORY38187.1 hypothetical protein BCR33DRAFT_720893 [Rhizoclosmatium globosum]
MTFETRVGELPEAFLLRTLRYCDSKTVARVAQANRRFHGLANSGALWRHVTVSGRSAAALKFVEQVLIGRAEHIESISFESISFAKTPKSNVSPETFFAAVDKLLAIVGSKLIELRIEDAVSSLIPEAPMQFRLPIHSSLMPPADPVSLFGNIKLLLDSVGRHCPNVKKVVLSGDEDSSYVGDANIFLLTQSCPSVETFVDEESCGLTATAIIHMAAGWPKLKSLALDTEGMSVEDFSASVSLFGDRLTNLSISNFADPLDDEAFQVLLSTLQKLPSLKVLAIDHSLTRNLDGLDSVQTTRLLESCPNLQGFEYFPTIESYFDFDDESDIRSLTGSHSLVDQDPELLIDSWRAYRAKSMYSRSRRGSIGSASMATTHFGKGSPEDEEFNDVTSLAPALPSPNEDNRNRVEVYGMWQSGDKLSIRERALRILGFESGSDFFVGKQEIFFAILDSVHEVCRAKGVKVTFAWQL